MLASAALVAILLVKPFSSWAQDVAGAENQSQFVQALPLEPGSRLVEIDREQVGDSTIYRYQQNYLDIPIHGRHVTLRENADGEALSTFGEVVEGLSEALPSISPSITEVDAKRAARRHFRSTASTDYSISRQRARLEIVADDNAPPKLVYVVTFVAQSDSATPKSPLTLVDAVTGQVLRQYDTAASIRFRGTGPGGNSNTGLVEYGRSAPFLDVRKVDETCYLRNAYVRVVNMRELPGNWFLDPHEYDCPRNEVKAVNGAYSPMNDLLFYGTSVFEMFQLYLGKRAIPAPRRVMFLAHYDNNATAVWAGDRDMIAIGNGDDEHHPYAVMDIVAHEIAHGFTDYNSGLIRDWDKESSAIDEAFSDMAGEAFEHYMRGVNHFVLGEDASKNGTPERDMREPTRIGGGIDHIDAYRAAKRAHPTGEVDPHRASGIYNKAFFLIATSPGWDTKQAFRLFARANDWYFSPDTNFEQGACIVIRTASELGLPSEPVVSAFEEVGISCGVNWERSTATGFFSSGKPKIRDAGKTVSSPPSPSDGMWIYAARTDRSVSSGKRYIELKVGKQRSAPLHYSYSGFVSLVLQTDEHGVGYDADYGIGQMLTLGWPLEKDSDPVAVAVPWLWANWDQNAVFNRSPVMGGPVSEGDVIGVAIDFEAGKVWYSLNGVWRGSPSSGQGAAFDEASLSPDYHFSGRRMRLKALAEFSDVSVTLQSTNATFDYPVPVGYSAW